MTKIERTIRELDDLWQFYYQIKQRKQTLDQVSGNCSNTQPSKPAGSEKSVTPSMPDS